MTFWEFMYWLVKNDHLEEVAEELRAKRCPENHIAGWIILAQQQVGTAHPPQLNTREPQ